MPSITVHLCDWCLKSLGFSDSDLPPDPHFGVSVNNSIWKRPGETYTAPLLAEKWWKICPECADEFRRAHEQFEARITARFGVNEPRKQPGQTGTRFPELPYK